MASWTLFTKSWISSFLRILFSRHPRKIVDESEFSLFLHNLAPFDYGFELLRYGSRGDCGYVIPNLQYDFCFSAGVGNDISFELDLSKSLPNCRFILLDASVERPPNLPKSNLFEFRKKFLRSFDSADAVSVSLDSCLAHFPALQTSLVKIDIEGGEHAALGAASDETFDKIDVLVVEFHNLFHTLDDFHFQTTYKPLFNRLNFFFDVIWLSAVGTGGFFFDHGKLIPNLIEVTFINRAKYGNRRLSYLDTKPMRHLLTDYSYNPQNMKSIIYEDFSFSFLK